MTDVWTDHQIVALGTDKMRLFDRNTGDELAVATRTAGVWTVHADGVDDIDVPHGGGDQPRADAITAMTEHALAALPGQGYSTMVPYGLADMP